jgi:hypothetical protein
MGAVGQGGVLQPPVEDDAVLRCREVVHIDVGQRQPGGLEAGGQIGVARQHDARPRAVCTSSQIEQSVELSTRQPLRLVQQKEVQAARLSREPILTVRDVLIRHALPTIVRQRLKPEQRRGLAGAQPTSNLNVRL